MSFLGLMPKYMINLKAMDEAIQVIRTRRTLYKYLTYKALNEVTSLLTYLRKSFFVPKIHIFPEICIFGTLFCFEGVGRTLIAQSNGKRILRMFDPFIF